MRRLLLALTAVSALVLAGCTASPPAPRPTASVVRLTSARSTAAADGSTPAARAVEASRALFAASPGVVLAPEDDGSAQAAAAIAAERLHVPMLLTAAGSTATPAASTAADPVAAEAHRLGATWTVGFGAGARIARLRARPASITPPGSVSQPCAVVVATDPSADPAALATARAAGATVVQAETTDLNGDPGVVQAIAAAKDDRVVLVGSAFAQRADLSWSVAAARTGWAYAGGAQRAWDGRSLHIALYGTPADAQLGVLGQQPEAATIARVKSLSAQYGALTDRSPGTR